MRIAVIFESMFGETRRVASAIAEGLAPFGVITLANVNYAGAADAAEHADLLVIGGPTHVHGMSRVGTRAEACNWANDAARHLTLEPLAPGIGVREWMDTLKSVPRVYAAFDTRMDSARILTGAASGGVSYRLTQRGAHPLQTAASFLVSKKGQLDDGELARARTWGATVGRALADLPVRR